MHKGVARVRHHLQEGHRRGDAHQVQQCLQRMSQKPARTAVCSAVQQWLAQQCSHFLSHWFAADLELVQGDLTLDIKAVEPPQDCVRCPAEQMQSMMVPLVC